MVDNEALHQAWDRVAHAWSPPWVWKRLVRCDKDLSAQLSVVSIIIVANTFGVHRRKRVSFGWEISAYRKQWLLNWALAELVALGDKWWWFLRKTFFSSISFLKWWTIFQITCCVLITKGQKNRVRPDNLINFYRWANPKANGGFWHPGTSPYASISGVNWGQKFSYCQSRSRGPHT